MSHHFLSLQVISDDCCPLFRPALPQDSTLTSTVPERHRPGARRRIQTNGPCRPEPATVSGVRGPRGGSAGLQGAQRVPPTHTTFPVRSLDQTSSLQTFTHQLLNRCVIASWGGCAGHGPHQWAHAGLEAWASRQIPSSPEDGKDRLITRPELLLACLLTCKKRFY